jgi:hypothetical protein
MEAAAAAAEEREAGPAAAPDTVPARDMGVAGVDQCEWRETFWEDRGGSSRDGSKRSRTIRNYRIRLADSQAPADGADGDLCVTRAREGRAAWFEAVGWTAGCDLGPLLVALNSLIGNPGWKAAHDVIEAYLGVKIEGDGE